MAAQATSVGPPGASPQRIAVHRNRKVVRIERVNPLRLPLIDQNHVVGRNRLTAIRSRDDRRLRRPLFKEMKYDVASAHPRRVSVSLLRFHTLSGIPIWPRVRFVTVSYQTGGWKTKNKSLCKWSFPAAALLAIARAVRTAPGLVHTKLDRCDASPSLARKYRAPRQPARRRKPRLETLDVHNPTSWFLSQMHTVHELSDPCPSGFPCRYYVSIPYPIPIWPRVRFVTVSNGRMRRTSHYGVISCLSCVLAFWDPRHAAGLPTSARQRKEFWGPRAWLFNL